MRVISVFTYAAEHRLHRRSSQPNKRFNPNKELKCLHNNNVTTIISYYGVCHAECKLKLSPEWRTNIQIYVQIYRVAKKSGELHVTFPPFHCIFSFTSFSVNLCPQSYFLSTQNSQSKAMSTPGRHHYNHYNWNSENCDITFIAFSAAVAPCTVANSFWISEWSQFLDQCDLNYIAQSEIVGCFRKLDFD